MTTLAPCARGYHHAPYATAAGPASSPRGGAARPPSAALPCARSVKFNLEGDRGQKATAWAEVRAGTHDLRYLIVLAKDKTRVWSVVDGRRPEPTTEERLQRLSSALQDAKWVFYADNAVDAREQESVLGEYWMKVKCVRCDDAPALCTDAGVASCPAWTTHRKGEILKGVRSSKELEAAAGDLLYGRKGKWWWPFSNP